VDKQEFSASSWRSNQGYGIVNQVSKIQVGYPEDGSRNLPPKL